MLCAFLGLFGPFWPLVTLSTPVETSAGLFLRSGLINDVLWASTSVRNRLLVVFDQYSGTKTINKRVFVPFWPLVTLCTPVETSAGLFLRSGLTNDVLLASKSVRNRLLVVFDQYSGTKTTNKRVSGPFWAFLGLSGHL